jgi:CxxC-x17-CxxC domain-containing protein
MKQALKNEADMLTLISQISSQITTLERKIDALINRPSAQPPKPAPAPNHPKERPSFKIICADCNKEDSLPFKPTGDRPVYCRDCFSKRRMVSMSRVGVKPEEEVISAEPKVKTSRKAVAVRKPAAKRKPTPKKK